MPVEEITHKKILLTDIEKVKNLLMLNWKFIVDSSNPSVEQKEIQIITQILYLLGIITDEEKELWKLRSFYVCPGHENSLKFCNYCGDKKEWNKQNTIDSFKIMLEKFTAKLNNVK